MPLASWQSTAGSARGALCRCPSPSPSLPQSGAALRSGCALGCCCRRPLPEWQPFGNEEGMQHAGCLQLVWWALVKAGVDELAQATVAANLVVMEGWRQWRG
jgi:hypothetical protein